MRTYPHGYLASLGFIEADATSDATGDSYDEDAPDNAPGRDPSTRARIIASRAAASDAEFDHPTRQGSILSTADPVKALNQHLSTWLTAHKQAVMLTAGVAAAVVLGLPLLAGPPAKARRNGRRRRNRRRR